MKLNKLPKHNYIRVLEHVRETMRAREHEIMKAC